MPIAKLESNCLLNHLPLRLYQILLKNKFSNALQLNGLVCPGDKWILKLYNFQGFLGPPNRDLARIWHNCACTLVAFHINISAYHSLFLLIGTFFHFPRNNIYFAYFKFSYDY